MFTRGNQRLLVRGDSKSVGITIDRAKTLGEKGYRFSGHTHPGYDINVLTASDGDYDILEAFGQKQSVVYNSKVSI